MYTLDNIPHLRAFQPIISLPERAGDPTRGTVVFLSAPDSEKSLTMLDGKYIHNKNIHNYYLERIYHERIGARVEHKILPFKSSIRFKTTPATIVNGVTSFANIPTGKNRFIDISVYNEIFFQVLSESSLTYNNICKEYLELLKRTIVKTEFSGFDNKAVLINVDDWEEFSNKTFGRPDSLNNPASIIYYLLYKNLQGFKDLGDIDILIYSKSSGYKMRINPRECDEGSAIRFRSEASRISPNTSKVVSDNFDRQIREEEVRDELADTFIERFNLTGEPSKAATAVKKEIKTAIDKKDNEKTDTIIDNKEEIENEVDKDKELAKKVTDIIAINKVGKSKSSSKRDQILREKQKEVKVGNKTLGEILDDADPVEIPSNDVSDKVKTTNKNITKITFTNFEKAYNSKLLQKDTMSMITALNNARLPVHVRSVKIEDKSDELNYINRYYVQLEDENRVRHSLTFDMPKFIDDKFMYLHGNRKEIVKQQFMLPIVKAKPNEVQIVSNYNKIFIHRYGDKVSPKMEKFKKYIASSPKGMTYKLGNQSTANKGYVRTIEFDELSKVYEYLDNGKIKVMFNLKKVEEICKEKGYEFELDKDGKHYIAIGFFKGNAKDPVIYLNTDTQNVIEGNDIVSTFLSFVDDEEIKAINRIAVGKRYMYTRGTLMSKPVPIALLIAYCEGITTLLRKSNAKFYFTDKRPKLNLDERVIEFEDGYLVYEVVDLDKSILLNGLTAIPTRAYKFEELDVRETYLDIFDAMYKQRNIASAFDNFYDFMIDPITKEILEDLDLPTEFVDVLIYASNLLADNDYTDETDLSLYRIRSNEIVTSYLYKSIVDAYATYIATSNNPNPIKISIPREAVTKKILTAQTIEDYSVLNPIVEVEKGRAVTAKGPSGANIPESYTMAKRSYSPSMTGVMAMTSSPDANVGMVRALSLEPSITSARGYISNNQDRINDLKDANIFSPGELASPMGASRDKSCCPTMQKCIVKNSSN